MKLILKRITTHTQPCPKCNMDSALISYSMGKVYMKCIDCGLEGPRTKLPDDNISPSKITLPSYIQKKAKIRWNHLWIFKQL